MATFSTSPIRFEYDRSAKRFNVLDLPSEQAIQDIDQRHMMSEIMYSAKLIHCRYAEIKGTNCLSLESCTVDKVVAKGNIILSNSNVKEVCSIEGEVFVLNNSKTDCIQAKLVYTTQKLSGCVKGGLLILGPKHEGNGFANLILRKDGYVEKEIRPDKTVSSVTLEGAVCAGDVIFPEDSIVPEEERVVILKDGGKLLGKVIRGHLKEEAV